MKKKIITLLLLVSLVLSMLTSCNILEGLGSDSSQSSNQTPIFNGTINVEGGPNYGDINITTSYNKNLLAASKALLSVVRVTSAFEEVTSSWLGSSTDKVKSIGAGVIYKLDKEKGDAYIITNYHVVYDEKSNTSDHISDDIILHLYGLERPTASGKSYDIPATFVGGSIKYDLAVLKVTGSTVLMESDAMACGVADSDAVSVLDTAIAIGNSGGDGISATIGAISVDSEEISLAIGSANIKVRVMRTDAAINKGNSGGGLFDDNGDLIGIPNAKDPDGTVDNVGYAIPSNLATAIADNVIHYSDGTLKRCQLGIWVGVNEYSTKYDTETGKVHKYEEVIITEFTKESQTTSLLAVGDIINSITVDGVKKDVTRVHHVVDMMFTARVGSTVVINVLRDGTEMDVTIPITEKMLSVA